jgi:hypothetical protein
MPGQNAVVATKSSTLIFVVAILIEKISFLWFVSLG